jgi:cytochrome c oxidase cbb3-type subunit III
MAKKATTTRSRSGVEIDPVTGQPTTGHVWDGIRELNRPLPRWWLWTFYATIAWALVYVVLYPAIPLVRGATSGVLGYSTRAEVADAMIAARTARRPAGSSRSPPCRSRRSRADPELARFAVAGGRSAFLVNCIQCHGTGAAGSPGYANLNDDDWLWGGTLDEIHQTIAYGVRSDHPDARFSEMPAFGADGC